VPDLLKIDADSWCLKIAGKIPELPPFISLTPETTVVAGGIVRLSVFNRETDQLEPIVSGAIIEPIFFENTRYDFYLSDISGVATLCLPPAGTFHNKVDSITHYSLNFQNEVGFSEITVRDGTNTTIVRFEVFPRKIDYRVDYAHMRDEIASIARNLVLTVQARAFGLASPFPTQQPTLTEWLSLIRYYFRRLVLTTKAIAQNPHSTLVKEIVNTPVERARRVDNRALERQARRRVAPSGISIKGSGIQLPRQVPESRRYVTYNTPENRYLKAILVETQRNLQRALHAQLSGDEDADASAEQRFFRAIRSEVGEMLRDVQRLLREPFLKDVATGPAKRPSSLVFHRHPHYVAFDQIARAVNGGLSLDGGPLRVGVKDIALLYEYWCFLKLVQLLREHFELEQQSIIRLNHMKITVVLQKGERAAIRFRDPSSGKHLFLVYNRRFNRLPTISQRPDNVIQIASEERLYIFDAKYRIAFDAEYQRQFGGIGPPVEDINTMHRYRDAIVIPHPARANVYLRGIVESAIILFPYPEETAYYHQRFYQSIEKVQIGGLPFLPNTTEAVTNVVRDILKQEGFALSSAGGSEASSHPNSE